MQLPALSKVIAHGCQLLLSVSCRGDQHDPSVVEYFLTENLLAYFNQILQQRSNRRGNVATQVLQTLSILIQNVRNQQTVYYLFSNNHINEIVTMRFDFEDDEVLVSLSCALIMWGLPMVQLFNYLWANGCKAGVSRGSAPWPIKVKASMSGFLSAGVLR